MKENRWRIPQRLDEPARILFLYRWEVLLIFISVFGGLIANRLIFSLLISVGVVFLLRKFATMLNGLSPHAMAYWFLGLNNLNLPVSWKRYWRG